jgi:GPH family glycoside/pentoside/hexuronide:cation symporter
VVGLEPGTTQAAVAPDVVTKLAIAYPLVTAVLALTAAYWLARFPISQADHEARVAARMAAARSIPGAPAPHK